MFVPSNKSLNQEQERAMACAGLPHNNALNGLLNNKEAMKSNSLSAATAHLLLTLASYVGRDLRYFFLSHPYCVADLQVVFAIDTA